MNTGSRENGSNGSVLAQLDNGVILSQRGEGTMPDKYAKTKQKWKAENTKIFTTRLSKVSEQDVIAWMESHKPTNAYIKGLIRKDMESSNQQ